MLFVSFKPSTINLFNVECEPFGPGRLLFEKCCRRKNEEEADEEKRKKKGQIRFSTDVDSAGRVVDRSTCILNREVRQGGSSTALLSGF